jgi:hypothetical protein
LRAIVTTGREAVRTRRCSSFAETFPSRVMLGLKITMSTARLFLSALLMAGTRSPSAVVIPASMPMLRHCSTIPAWTSRPSELRANSLAVSCSFSSANATADIRSSNR